ncbi:hypothetical protein DPV78_012711 [Talaromyces pinophilus]|nr:hypothetical protein DPV78_012711 [Talaromyces pinophilus]
MDGRRGGWGQMWGRCGPYRPHSSWFRSNQSTHVSPIHVIIVREVEDDNTGSSILSIHQDEVLEKKKIKKEQKQKSKIKTEPKLKPEHSVRQTNKKRSFSVALNETKSGEPDLPSPVALLEPEEPTEYIANRTRNRHPLQQEGL